MFWASIQFFVVLDAAVQMQHITNHLVKVPVILIVHSSLLVFRYFHPFRQNGSQHWWKCSWKGMKESSVSPWTTGRLQVLTSVSWISPIGQPKYFGKLNAMVISTELLSPETGITFTTESPAEKSWSAVLRHPVCAPSHFAQHCRCWTPKASSPAHYRRCTSTWASPRFAKNRNCKKLWIWKKSANYICNPPHKSTAKCTAFRGFSTVFTLPSVGGYWQYSH